MATRIEEELRFGVQTDDTISERAGSFLHGFFAWFFGRELPVVEQIVGSVAPSSRREGEGVPLARVGKVLLFQLERAGGQGLKEKRIDVFVAVVEAASKEPDVGRSGRRFRIDAILARRQLFHQLGHQTVVLFVEREHRVHRFSALCHLVVEKAMRLEFRCKGGVELSSFRCLPVVLDRQW